ncbi:GAF domain-containing sensor histidine kinase [Pseudanabaena sp. BC1403]|uniref:GAF domain-containing sensor histidine kinase n=1 Tax=Pseudanabaena sp. BC1403 TaxID=2043171 RepID=UPI000CD84DBD|nr:GAF domain-containing sensor histidine kinase [Pseudanabaena sp. BC1403]
MPQNFLHLNEDHKETLSDRLLKASANATSVLLTITPLDDAVNTAIKIIGEALETDRVSVIENFDCPEQPLPCWKMLYEWNSLGTVSQISHPEVSQGTYEGIESWYENINQGQSVTYLTKDMPEPFRSGQEKLGVKALHVVPIFVENKCWGVVGFDDCREVKHRGQSELSVLKIAANSIGCAIQRDRTQQALLRSQQERATELEKANKALRSAIAGMARLDNLEHFLAEMLKASLEISGAHTGAVALVEGEFIRHAVLFDQDGWIDPQIQMSRGLTISPFTPELKDLAEQLLKSPLGWVVPPHDPRIMPEYREFHREHNNKAIRLVPMQISDRLIGWLGLGFADENPSIGKNFGLLKVLAEQMTMAVEMLRLSNEAQQTAIAHEQEQAAAARVVQLVKANAVLKQTLDVLATEPEIESSLGHVLKVSSEQLDSPSSALWLYNSSTEKFYPHLVYMDNQIIPVTAENIDILAGKWLRGRNMDKDLFLKKHIRERSPAIYQVDDASVVPTPLRKSLENMGVKTLLGIPLLLGTEIIGSFTLRFTKKRQFQAEELELTQALANQATLAIQLIRMAEEAKQAAIYEERNRLAGEIHDTLAQAFTGISLQLGVAKWLLQEGSLAIEPILDRINDIAQTGLAEARRSVWEIYPTAQEYANLAEKFSQSVEKLTRDCPIQVDLQILGSEYQVSAMIGYNLLKLAQEAITNALKHAKATKLAIVLTYQNALVSLRITDNGCGFQPNLDNGGFGLLSISERSDRIGGQLLINSILGKGTEILVEIPLEEQKS